LTPVETLTQKIHEKSNINLVVQFVEMDIQAIRKEEELVLGTVELLPNSIKVITEKQ
jgi:hypothetical protein